MTPGHALLPLRLFLGITFAYAGIHKLADAGFLAAGSETYIGSQLEAFAEGTPGGPLLEAFALPQPALAGVGVALTEVAIGLLAIAGRFTRATAAAGLGLSLVLFLTASWHTRPYFLGSDIIFVYAWLPFVLAGATARSAALPPRALGPGDGRADEGTGAAPAGRARGGRARRQGGACLTTVVELWNNPWRWLASRSCSPLSASPPPAPPRRSDRPGPTLSGSAPRASSSAARCSSRSCLRFPAPSAAAGR